MSATSAISAALPAATKAVEQTGIIGGANPSHYNKSDPIVVFIVQVGLEVDFRIMMQNWQIALGVGTLGMILPFGFGAAIAYGLYNEFGQDEGVNTGVNFGVFLLFVGVAFSITAFPVLCRILTELKLLGTNVGVIVLAAGVGNDVVGWILLALTVALVNAGSGITALYVLLSATGYVLFLFFVVKPIFHWYLRRTGNLGSNGPSQSALTITLLMTLCSAWFTDVIGIHAIFGGFVVGLICPHEAGFAVAVAEKIEDLITVLFLPLYFTLSGLRTNIGLLNSGIVWGYVIAVLAVAFIAKIAGGTIAARAFKLRWRESLTVGALMSCKGLVELIVLNIGLTAGIISQRTFTIFVVMALITTFVTTPLVSFLYPEWYQKKTAAWRAGKINWDGTPTGSSDDDEPNTKVKTSVNRLTVLLRLDSLPSLMALISLLKGEKEVLPPIVHKSKKGEESSSKKDEVLPVGTTGPRSPRFEVHGLRLRELGERTSAVMRVAEESEFAERDPVVNTFKSFGRMNNIACATGLSIIPESSFSGVLSDRAKDTSSDLLIVPWSETGQIGDNYDQNMETKEHRFESGPYVNFMTSLLQDSASNVAIFINRGFGGVNRDRNDKTLTRRGSTVSAAISRVRTGIEAEATLPVLDPSHHIFFPFIGGDDDRAALRFVLQLVKNNNVTATIVQITHTGAADEASKDVSAVQASSSSPNGTSEEDAAFYLQIAASLPDELSTRVVFETQETDQPIQTLITRAKQEVGTTLKNAGDLIVVGRGHATEYESQLAAITDEHAPHVSADTKKVIGTVAKAVLVAQVRASLLVYRAS
ncbi:hypothetical protein ABW20_dc0107935 [Dactylellina cionopaga]|nr:hypothetical protein ABW20_dc0107935 [Dactylellina cionopaga]